MTDAPEFTGLCELTLETSDVEGLARFYAALGLERLDEDDDRIWFATGERSRLGIWSRGEKEHDDRGGSHVHFALSVSPVGLDQAVEGLRERGLEVEGPVEHDGGDRSAYFDDPEGNRVELWDFFELRGDVGALKE